MHRLVMFVVVFGAFSLAHGQAASNGDVPLHGGNAERLINQCSGVEHIDVNAGMAPAKDVQGISYCFGYLFAFWDFRNILNAGVAGGKYDTCIPDNASATQLAKVVVRYGNDHPEELNEPALALVSSAFKKAFPCK